MIIECIKCGKKFEVNSELIPSEGRTIQCGSCDEVWFYKKNDEVTKDFNIEIQDIELNENHSDNIQNKQKKDYSKKTIKEKKGSEIVQYTPKSSFTFGKFLSYIVVTILSFIALLIILDTFKIQLYSLLPDLEIWLFSLYEILKDIRLFIRDLI